MTEHEEMLPPATPSSLAEVRSVHEALYQQIEEGRRQLEARITAAQTARKALNEEITMLRAALAELPRAPVKKKPRAKASSVPANNNGAGSHRPRSDE